MLRLALKLAIAGVALWALWSFVPVGGRTMAARWRAARTPSAFVEDGWAELTGDRAGGPRKKGIPPARSQARSPQPVPSRERPTEGHSDADRRALDRIVSEHLSEQR